MSRIGKLPVEIPDKVEVKVDGKHVAVKGPLGQLERTFTGVTIALEGDAVNVTPEDTGRRNRALWGLSRTLISNMVVGVSKGFERKLLITGVGYRADLQDRTLVLSVGYSHQINFPLPEGIGCEVEKLTSIKLSGVDKQLVGQTAATIRSFRPPEPYKGKGIRYSDEHVRRKAGKAGK